MKRALFKPEHDDFRESVRTFIAREAVPYAEEWEARGMVDPAFWRKAGELGFLGFTVPEAYGGLGLEDFRFNAILTEEMVKAQVGGDNFSMQNDIISPYLIDDCDEEQKKRWLPSFAQGELIVAIAMTEPEAGSDLRAMGATARRTEGGYLLNGSKTFITSGIQAGLVIVAAQLEKAGITLFAVEDGTPGFAKGRKLEKVGRRAQDTAELFFTDVEVPTENLIGAEGGGMELLKHHLAQERLSIAVTAVAAANTAFALTRTYCGERRSFGRSIDSHQALRFMLAEAAVKCDLCTKYLDQHIEAHLNGELTAVDAARLKLATTEMEFQVIDTCVQLHGGYGFMEEYPIARMWRDCRAQRIYGGTSEIMKEIIGQDIVRQGRGA